MLTIEFFHDVICSFCFPMSYRMRQIQEKNPDIKIIHRSFALAKGDNEMIAMFGSREAAKEEVLSHWQHANQNDDLHRFNIEGMRQTDFLFPTSMPALTAAKAAKLVADEEGYWMVFDALQQALFVENRNIEDTSVIEEVVKNTSINYVKWHTLFHNKQTVQAVEEDFKLAESYQLHGVPALIINGKYLISGAQPLAAIQEAIETIKEKETPTLEALSTEEDGQACRLENDKWQCD